MFPRLDKNISLFLGGHSVPALFGKKFEEIKSKTFTVGINHSFCKLDLDALIWQDYNVTKDLCTWVRNRLAKGEKLPVLWSREIAFSTAHKSMQAPPKLVALLRENVTEFIPKDKKAGSYTSTLCLEFLRGRYPDKKIYVFGLDMRGRNCWYDQYFEPIKKIKKCWDMSEYQIRPECPSTSKPIKFVRKARQDLNLFANDIYIYNMNRQSGFGEFQYLPLEELR